MNLLIIEDEADLRDSIKDYLQKQGYLCETAGDISEAYNKIDFYDYDCILLDIGLPGGSGLDIVKELRLAKSRAGIIIISARDSVSEKIEGLQLGGDDYLTKPFHLSELNARISSIIRRRNFNAEEKIFFNEITIDFAAKTAFVNNNPLDLTQKEFSLLIYFISNKGRLITKPALAQHVWGDNYSLSDSFDFIYTHIKNLRKKLIEAGATDYIKTMYGSGYRFTDI